MTDLEDFVDVAGGRLWAQAAGDDALIHPWDGHYLDWAPGHRSRQQVPR